MVQRQHFRPFSRLLFLILREFRPFQKKSRRWFEQRRHLNRMINGSLTFVLLICSLVASLIASETQIINIFPSDLHVEAKVFPVQEQEKCHQDNHIHPSSIIQWIPKPRSIVPPPKMRVNLNEARPTNTRQQGAQNPKRKTARTKKRNFDFLL